MNVVEQEYFTIRDAAPRLGMTPDALRRSCERIAVNTPTGLRADLGGGIVAIKFGKRKWLIKFPK